MLKVQCQVLVAIDEAEHGRATWAEVREATGLSDVSVSTALQELLRQQRIIRWAERHSRDGGDIYAINLDWNPTVVPPDDRWQRKPKETREAANDRKTGRMRVKRVQQTVEQEIATLPPYVRFVNRKLAVLRKLLDQVGAGDRDVLLGIIADYARHGEGRNTRQRVSA